MSRRPPAYRTAHRPLATAVHVALCAALVSPLYLTASVCHAQTEQRINSFNIPSGSLGSTLTRIAEQSGVLLTFDPALVEGQRAAAVTGEMTVQQALQRALQDSGLEVVAGSNGGYRVQRVDSVTLAPVKVSAGGLGSTTEGSGAYTTGAVALGKGAQSLREIPQSVSVVTRERLDDQSITTLPEAMKFVTGVTVQRFDGAGFFNTFNARGYAADSFQIDGVNVQVNANMADTDLAVYDRVEVQRGAAGLFQGSGEPGVTINLARKRALAESKLRGQLSAGSWDAYRSEADVTGKLDEEGRLRGRLLAAYEKRDSYLDGVGGDKQVAYGTVEYDLRDSTTLSLGGTWQKVESVIDQGLPAYADGRLLDVSRSTTILADWNLLDMETSDLFAELEHRLAGGGEIQLTVRHLERERLYKGARSNSAVGADGSVAIEYVHFPSDLEDTSADLFLSQPVTLLGREHNITVGADYRDGDNGTPFSTTAYSPASAVSNVFNHDSNTPEPDLIATGGRETRTETEQSGLYFRTRLRATDSLSVLLGGRVSNWESRTLDLTNHVVTASYEAENEFTPYAAAMLDLNQQLSLYVSYSEIFKPQNNITRSGEQIDPRTGVQYESGIKGEFLGGQLNAHAAVYWMEDQNRALTDPLDAQFSVASGEVRSKGFEAEISGQLMPGWQLTAGYAYTSTEYLKASAASEGQSFSPFTPRHNFNLWTKYSFSGGVLSGFDIGGGVRAVSDFYSGSGAVRFEAPGYATVSLLGGYRVTDHLYAALNIDNLLDRNYYEKVSGTTRQNFYGAPRSATLTLKYEL